MNYNIIAKHESFEEPVTVSGGNTRTTKDPVTITVTIEIERVKYENSNIIEKIEKAIK